MDRGRGSEWKKTCKLLRLDLHIGVWTIFPRLVFGRLPTVATFTLAENDDLVLPLKLVLSRCRDARCADSGTTPEENGWGQCLSRTVRWASGVCQAVGRVGMVGKPWSYTLSKLAVSQYVGINSITTAMTLTTLSKVYSGAHVSPRLFLEEAKNTLCTCSKSMHQSTK